ncbi:hypothetical protein ACHAW5_003813 [Stephanodiscus triporus]|uniref:Uncharacterized protein n=1 Tax=Stephanodiscus triporus TaxID=2934178 RepID=A0ABD3NIZ1_9STRA
MLCTPRIAITDNEVAQAADIPTHNLVVRFSESVDGFALPPGHTYESLCLSPPGHTAESLGLTKGGEKR